MLGGVVMWLSKKYILLRLSVKINVSMVRDLVSFVAKSSA